MIIKGKSRGGPTALGAHLGNAEKNERVSLLETMGTVAQDLRGALVEMDAYAAGTRCEKSLYHAAISPALPYRLTPEQRAEAVDALEAKLGLVGHSRVVVMHEKLGREHIHVVWSRIDLNTMKAVSDSHNYRKHEEVARDLERRFGHERVQGAHHEREGVARPDRTPSRAELRQEERTGIKGKEVKAEITAAFCASDSAEAFQAALHNAGYVLAKGDRRDFVIVDHAGGIHSLARRIDGIAAATLREFMAPIDRERLPDTERARAIAADRRRKREAHAEAKREVAYSRSEDYVTQTGAALRDHQRRQKPLDHAAGRDYLWDRIERGAKSLLQKGRGDAKKATLNDNGQKAASPKDRDGPTQKPDSALKAKDADISDARRVRMERLSKIRDEDNQKSVDRSDWSPDRQPEAPGGGRTRSR